MCHRTERLPCTWVSLRLGCRPEPPSERPPRLVPSPPVDTAAPWAVLPARAWIQGPTSGHTAELLRPLPHRPCGQQFRTSFAHIPKRVPMQAAWLGPLT